MDVIERPDNPKPFCPTPTRRPRRKNLTTAETMATAPVTADTPLLGEANNDSHADGGARRRTPARARARSR